MNWSKGYSVQHYATIVDVRTWKDIEKFNVESGSITRSTTDSLIESADLEIEPRSEFNFQQERWIRVYVDIRQNEGSYHGPLFTGLVCSPSKNIDGNTIKNNIQCYSVLKPAEDVLLPKGWYASTKLDATKIIKNLLDVTPAPVSIDRVYGQLTDNIVAENNETNLSMVNKIIDLMNWRISISGDGSIIIGSKPAITEDIIRFDSIEKDSLETDVTVNYDWFGCPNVFRATYNTLMAIAKDENAESPFSIQNRGREVWMEETDCKLGTNESLETYAKRRLKEEQSVAYNVDYKRRFHPDVNVGDIIKLDYPAQEIIGYFTVESQTINLGYSVSVSEKANKKV